jgi:molybdopterin-guanine dinucleotide biosynthesis protein A
LKTYLPDGDIDLAAFGSACSDESLANEVRAVLESEERRKDAEFEVKDVQYINAEVSLQIALCFVVFFY